MAFVKFTVIEWDADMYFSASEFEAHLSTDFIIQVERSPMMRAAAYPATRHEDVDQRHLWVGVEATDILQASLNGDTPRRITVRGSVDEVLAALGSPA